MSSIPAAPRNRCIATIISASRAPSYLAHVHRLSPVLTPRGAGAHCDMPVETGPTLYLPYSQTCLPGCLATMREDFRAYFAHPRAAAACKRRRRLLHSGGLPGRGDEPLQRRPPHGAPSASVLGLWPRHRKRRPRAHERRALSRVAEACRRRPDVWREIANAIAACAEGYAFPTNLDREPPIGGLAPQSQQALMAHALAEHWNDEAFTKADEAQRKLT